MIHYDFIEIGTCYFGTIIEGCDTNAVGLSIEPIAEYLQQLPNKPKVIKLNAAVVAPNDVPPEGKINLYHVPLETIRKHNLDNNLAGCNTVCKPHIFHTHYTSPISLWHETSDKSTLKTRNILEEGLVTVSRVDCITYEEIMSTFQVGKVDFLKIDTEGYDSILLGSILDYYENRKEYLPDKIQFETNCHTPRDQIMHVFERLGKFNYHVPHSPVTDDTIAIRKQ